MAHLADVTSEVRIALKLFVVSLGVVFLVFMFLKGGQIAKNLFFPSPLPPPEEKFGKLPRISFPSQNPTILEYQINTLTGQLPGFPDRLKVYKVKTKEPSLVTLQSTRDNLAGLGFAKKEKKINNTVYQWTRDDQAVIQYNTNNDNFEINSNFITNPAFSPNGTIPGKDTAYKASIDFLSALNLDTTDIDPNLSQAKFLKILNGQLTEAESQNNAQFTRVDLIQKSINSKYPIHYPNVDQSIMYFILETKDNVPKIVEANYQNLIPDQDNSSDYPIKTAQNALEDLKKGNALIFNSGNSGPIDITDVSLGYYLGQENQEYLLPVIIFKGKNFTAYVNAIPEASIGN